MRIHDFLEVRRNFLDILSRRNEIELDEISIDISTNFVGKQKTNGFQRLFSSINIIAEEQIVRFRWKSTVFK